MSKTHYMAFHRARKIYHEDIFLNNNILQQVHSTKCLGIIIYVKLKWANHTSYIKNKIAKSMGILLKARKVLKYKCYCSNTFISCFHTLFIVPKYGVLLLIFTSNHSLYSRRKIVRIISFSRYNSPTKLLFQQYNIIPFKKLVFHRPGLQLYKYEFGIIPIALRSLFTKNSSVHNDKTRNSNKLRPAFAKHAYRDEDFRCISVHVLIYVSINGSFPSFKKSLKCFILSEKFSFKL